MNEYEIEFQVKVRSGQIRAVVVGPHDGILRSKWYDTREEALRDLVLEYAEYFFDD